MIPGDGRTWTHRNGTQNAASAANSRPILVPTDRQVSGQRFPCFWALLNHDLRFIFVFPDWGNDLKLVGTLFVDHVPTGNAKQLDTLVRESLQEQSLNGFYIRYVTQVYEYINCFRCGFKVNKVVRSVENLFVPLHDHLSLIIVHGFEPQHQCSMKNVPTLSLTLQECKDALEQRPEQEHAPRMLKGNGRPAVPPRPPGWKSRTLFVLDARSMRPLVMEPIDRAEALTGLPWQRVRIFFFG
jgi:hypothetical protein